MPRLPRVDVGGFYYHVLNRANAGITLFRNDQDYAAFDKVLSGGIHKLGMRILAYCLMPNHWHLVLWPRKDGDMSHFMAWVSTTHAHRWHGYRHNAGTGHLYQDRYKSSIIQDDRHFLTVARYIERNPLRAGLVRNAEEWRWGSLWRRQHKRKMRGLVDNWPVPRPGEWVRLVNRETATNELSELRASILRGRPYGDGNWQTLIARRYGLEMSLHSRGRPSKKGV